MRTRRHVPRTQQPSRSLLASRHTLSALIALLLVPVVVTLPIPVRAANDVVTTCASSGPGSLPVVLDAAVTGDTISFMQDCTSANAITLTAPLEPTVNVTIDATAVPAHAVTISGGDSARLFFINKGITGGLRGLTLINGFSVNGGAILNYGTLNVVNSTFSANIALVDDSGTIGGGGGAIGNFGTATVVGSTFSGNAASDHGGAIFDSTDMLRPYPETRSDLEKISWAQARCTKAR